LEVGCRATTTLQKNLFLQNHGGGRDPSMDAAPVKKETRSISSNSSSSGGNTSGFGRIYYLNTNSVNVTFVFIEDISIFVLLPKSQSNHMLLHALFLLTGKTNTFIRFTRKC
jgi:hypothetical protein